MTFPFGVTHDFTYDLTHPEVFNPVGPRGSPWVPVGPRGSPWVTVGHRASSCPASCVLCTARPPADVQKLLGHLKLRDCWQCHMWVRSTIESEFGVKSTVDWCSNVTSERKNLSIEPGTSTRHVPEKKRPSTQVEPGQDPSRTHCFNSWGPVRALPNLNLGDT